MIVTPPPPSLSLSLSPPPPPPPQVFVRAKRGLAPARRLVARPRCRDGAAQRARRLHPPQRGRLDLGRARHPDHRIEPRREGPVLRPPRTRSTATRRSTTSPPKSSTCERTSPTYALRLGDDALILAHRLGEWIAAAPQIEEDIALANIGLDLLGQARSLLTRAGEVEGEGRTEDDLAYLRDERDFLNVQLCEQPNGDFAVTTARQLVFSTYQLALYDRLQSSSDEVLAGVAGKAVKEVDYHRDHATQWVLRLGDGTEESHSRMQAGARQLGPFVAELFASDELEQRLVHEGVAVDSSALRPECEATSGRCWPRRRSSCPSRRGMRAVVGPASTPRRWVVSSPRCSICTVRTRGASW